MEDDSRSMIEKHMIFGIPSFYLIIKYVINKLGIDPQTTRKAIDNKLLDG